MSNESLRRNGNKQSPCIISVGLFWSFYANKARKYIEIMLIPISTLLKVIKNQLERQKETHFAQVCKCLSSFVN